MIHRYARGLVLAPLLLAALPADASFLSGETLDTAADWLALFVLCVVPIGAIVVFWLVHVLPEKIAEKRHHPQKDAITTLCLLSLVFGGMLWPIAWLWAYTRPVAYKTAYGTDKHDSYFVEKAALARDGKLLRDDIRALRLELDAMAERGTLPAPLEGLRKELDELAAVAQARDAQAAAATPAAGGKA